MWELEVLRKALYSIKLQLTILDDINTYVSLLNRSVFKEPT